MMPLAWAAVAPFALVRDPSRWSVPVVVGGRRRQPRRSLAAATAVLPPPPPEPALGACGPASGASSPLPHPPPPPLGTPPPVGRRTLLTAAAGAAAAAASVATAGSGGFPLPAAAAAGLRPSPPPAEAAAAAPDLTPLYTRTGSGLEYYDFRVGTGAVPADGDEVTLHYTARLADRFGWPYDSTYAASDRDTPGGGTGGVAQGEPRVLRLGRDRLIPGLVEGLEAGMRVGGKRRLLIPPALGYVDEQMGPVPRRYGDRRRLWATVLNPRRVESAGALVLDVELLRVRRPGGGGRGRGGPGGEGDVDTPVTQ